MPNWRFLFYGSFIALLTLESVFLVACLHGNDLGAVIGRHASRDGGEIELLSPVYALDQVYMSMHGPRSNHPRIRLTDPSRKAETLWLTGVETQIVDANGGKPISNEYFCHSNLTLSPETTTPDIHNASFSQPKHATWRLFTLIPGRMNMSLPEGFGVPIQSRTRVDYLTMALNQNVGQEAREIRMRTRIQYRKAQDGVPPKSLFRRALYVYQQHSEADQQFEFNLKIAKHLGEICAEDCRDDQRGDSPSRFGISLDFHPGATCCVENASADGIVAQFGNENTVHWMVPPGKHEFRSEVTEQMELPFDTSAHYVTGHLHPFGESLRLIDMESKEVVFEVLARSFQDRLGVDWISEMKSTEGVAITRDRRYELVANYNNTSDHSIDAMAIMYLYLLESTEDY